MRKCQEHKRYKPILRPRSDCVDCWLMFVEETADYQTICQEIERRGSEINGTVIAQFDSRANEQRIIYNMLQERKKELENNL